MPAQRPVRAPEVTLRRRRDDGIALLERRGQFLQLSPGAQEIWRWCDGEHDVSAMARRYRERFHVDATAAIVALLEHWHATGYLARAGDATAPNTGSRHTIARSGASITVSWPVEHWQVVFERAASLVFAPFILAMVAIITVVGAALALRAPHSPAVYGVMQSVTLAVAFVICVVIHEAGHAVTLARFGGAVRRAGVGWYWCVPIAFVDTSDAHALTRAQRIGVSLGGPVASLFVAGLTAVTASLAVPDDVRAVAGALATLNYVATAWNLNPLMEFDGYYILADVLGRPNLRGDGFRALVRRKPDSVGIAYAVGAIAYAAMFAAFALTTGFRALASVFHVS